MSLNLGMRHQGEELYKFYINHDPGMTLTYRMARSTYVAHAIVKMSFEGKNFMDMDKWTEHL